MVLDGYACVDEEGGGMIREPDVHKFRHGNTPQDGIPQAPSVMCGEEISPIVRNYSHNWNKVTCLRCLALKKARS